MNKGKVKNILSSEESGPTSEEPAGSERSLIFHLSLFLFLLVSAAVLLQTACPTVYWWDSGELTTGLHFLGLPHSPSFPSFLCMNKTLLFLPLGSIAFRSNLISCLWATLTLALAVMLSAYIYRSKGNSENVTFLVWLCFLCSSVLWFQSVKVEVYSYHTFLTVLIVYMLWKSAYPAPGRTFSKAHAMKLLYLSSFIFGLAFCNHPLLLFFSVPGIIALIFLSPLKSCLSVRSVLSFFFFFLIGVSLYLYLPVRSATDPPIDLGNPENSEMFLLSFTRKSSYNRFFGSDIPVILKMVPSLLRHFYRQLGVMLLFLGAVGIVELFRRNVRQGAVLSVLFLGNAFGPLVNLNFGANPDTGEAYLMFAYVVFGIFAAGGTAGIIQLTALRVSNTLRKRIWTYGLVLSMSLLCSHRFLAFYSQNDLSRDNSALVYSRLLLDGLDKNSVFLTGFRSNLNFVLSYIQKVIRYRPDVMEINRAGLHHWHGFFENIRDQYPQVILPDLGHKSADLAFLYYASEILNKDELTREDRRRYFNELIKLIVRMNFRERTVYWASSRDDHLLRTFLRPHGTSFQFDPDGVFKKNQLSQEDEKIWDRIYSEIILHPDYESWTRQQNILQALFINQGVTCGAQNLFRAAVKQYKRAWLTGAQKYRKDLFKNFALTLRQAGNFNAAERMERHIFH